MGVLALILFLLIFILILFGFPVAPTLGGTSVLFALGVCFFAPEYFALSDFYFLPFRLMGILNNYLLIAVPLFIFMGIMLQKSGLAESLLETMASLFGRIPGGLAISVVIVGALLAASTGIVGATVVTMGLISLPTMMKRGYSKSLATGTIAASGTLGQIIPPSIVLVLLADSISSSSSGDTGVDVGTLFGAAIVPSVLLVGCYILYILIVSFFYPEKAPPMPLDEIKAMRGDRYFRTVIKAFVLPLLLIVAVLGSILWGVASPTEAAAIGAFGAVLLTIIQGKFNIGVLKEVMKQTTLLTSMVFLILLGATTFTLVFKTLGGDAFLVDMILEANLSPYVFLVLVLILIFVVGFFIDFIEIIFIIIPVVCPLFIALEMDMLWIAVLIAMNLQTSFLTPPFGFSLFYLKGVSPPEVKTMDIYRGVIPFIFIQITFIVILILFPSLVHVF